MKIYKFGILLFAVLCGILLTGCEEEKEESKEVKQMVLIYAVNHNNLSGDMVQNEKQILTAMQDFDTDQYKVLVYKYTSANPGLYEVVSDKNETVFKLIKEYDKSALSVTKERMEDVIDYAISLYPDANKDLFFWGHGSGWVNPSKYSATKVVGKPSASAPDTSVAPQSFGGEYIDDNSTKTEFLDIDQLALAVPDHVFDYIWFDCCYMSAIEIAYQLRNKCNTYIAYPTEIMADGLPYNRILPKVLTRDAVEGARILHNYYIERGEPVTVAVMDMSKIEGVMQTAKDIFALGEKRPSISDMQNYSRYYNTPYLDLGQYMREYVNANIGFDNPELAEAKKSQFEAALNDFVIYKAASDYDFNYPYGKPILPENYSGLSIHNYVGGDTERETYYRVYDWFKYTRGTNVSN